MIYAITDIETTGGSTKDTKITEIAIYLHNGEKVIDTFSSLINPERAIPAFISRLTGINDEMVADAPKFYEVAKKIIALTDETIFVAHNVGFDYRIIRNEFSSLGYDFRRPHLCTVRSSRSILPGYPSYSLGRLSESLGIKINGRHRASGDALATAKLFELLYAKNDDELNGFIQHEINPKALHKGLDLGTIDTLPQKTGIYRFYDENNAVIYIGKSKNIRSRVLQHLKNNSSKKAVSLREAIIQVDYELTGSELIALLKEAELIKKEKPIFNRQLRKTRSYYGLYSFEDGIGYIQLITSPIKQQTQTPYTTFEHKNAANNYLDWATEKFNLCQKLTGRYQTSGACFNYQVDRCNGACCKEEPVKIYNERINALLSHLNFDEKSFYIIVKGRIKDEIGIVYVEKGTYSGYGFIPSSITKENDTHLWSQYIKKTQEDKDAKRIIQAFLRKAPTAHVKVVS